MKICTSIVLVQLTAAICACLYVIRAFIIAQSCVHGSKDVRATVQTKTGMECSIARHHRVVFDGKTVAETTLRGFCTSGDIVLVLISWVIL